jgi:hypothetical protein
MPNDEFSWGPVARGIYIAMLWLTIVVGWHYPNMLIYYVPLLIFLGLGLKPLLVRTGFMGLFGNALNSIHDGHWERVTRQRRAEIARKERDKSYKYRRAKDPALPKDW